MEWRINRNKTITKNYITMNNINNLIDAHYNELEINDFDFYNDFTNNYNK